MCPSDVMLPRLNRSSASVLAFSPSAIIFFVGCNERPGAEVEIENCRDRARSGRSIAGVLAVDSNVFAVASTH